MGGGLLSENLTHNMGVFLGKKLTFDMGGGGFLGENLTHHMGAFLGTILTHNMGAFSCRNFKLNIGGPFYVKV